MKHIGYITIILTLVSCDGIKKSNDFDKVAVVDDVYQMLHDYHKDISKKGLTAEFKYLDPSPDFFWVPPGYNTALSYDSVKSILETNAKAFRSIEFHWDTLQIFPLSNEIANYSGIVGGFMIDTAGVKSTISIIESGTIIKREGGWKLLSGQSATLNTVSEK
ncbi:MAG: hypothetical protein IH852_11425 [Bacteroidetes bacterium]|nr:hypothetical protein [Bacteroidota bacterium]